jgi:hypothetical protein
MAQGRKAFGKGGKLPARHRWSARARARALGGRIGQRR